MAKYRATFKVACWKQQVCVGCGSKFRYRFECTETATATSKRGAAEAAERAADRAAKNGVGYSPCPACGIYQPDMVASTRGCGSLLVTIMMSVVMAVLLILAVCDVMTLATALWVVFAISLVTLLLQYKIASSNPNRDLVANRAVAKGELDAGKLQLLSQPQAGAVGSAPPDLSLRPIHWVVLGLFALGTLAIPSAEVVRIAMGWPRNAGWFPGVVGPGDWSCCYLDDQINSVQGRWNGKATAEVANAGRVGADKAALHATTSQESWGSLIIGKSTSNRSSTPWVRVEMPEGPQLGGQELQIDLRLDATYPASKGALSFADEHQSFTKTATVRLASTPHAGAIYERLGFGAGAGGVLLGGLAGLLLWVLGKRLGKLAHPPKTLPIRDEDDEIQDALPADG
jgi:hypothetical protein